VASYVWGRVPSRLGFVIEVEARTEPQKPLSDMFRRRWMELGQKHRAEWCWASSLTASVRVPMAGREDFLRFLWEHPSGV
jgi:hypothetical protein